ncbi:FAD-dependent oxidoreductase [Demequina lignilytica]|uniref:FAD-dependent oxidoreductase n=1 Tax=Demequina lignilytica TaxID=3051663 RepID=A0AB35MDZ3_9MICO|nr:FAD-dependent oxidoreductase [Demequina sp. SYSU T0a273]MDN4481993.1 FAD-dependent oxidoreductase [Demequina sp. SYSU T0a273]
MPEQLPTAAAVVVIGAGQAGLAVAYHLRRRGLTPGDDLLVLDANPGAGGAWRHRWPGLTLGGTHRLHDLPGMTDTGLTFTEADPHRPARELVAEYYGAYEDHHDLRVVRPARVTAVRRDGDGYLVECAPGSPVTAVRARVVVSATGTWNRPRLPLVDGREEFSGLQITTAEYTDPAPFVGLRVAVVGGGTSALTFLDEVGDVAQDLHWYTRRVPLFHDEEEELTAERGRIAVGIQDEAARAGRPLPSIVAVTGLPRSPLVRRLEGKDRLRREPMFASLDATGAVTADGEHVDLDAIIWATGFRPDLTHLQPLGVVNEVGGIVVEDGRVPEEPGLFLAGYGPQASTISSNRAARVTALTIARLLAGPQA